MVCISLQVCLGRRFHRLVLILFHLLLNGQSVCEISGSNFLKYHFDLIILVDQIEEIWDSALLTIRII